MAKTSQNPVRGAPSRSGRTNATFVQMQARGTVAIPKGIRERHHLDEPGAQIEFVERADGVIELRPHLPRPADQAWFWTEEWQRREAAASADFAEGRHHASADIDGFLSELDS